MPDAERTLSHAEARRFYDRLGARQDSQAFYEDRATTLLVRHGGFGAAQHVFEFGCGTGRFAEGLLTRELPTQANWRGMDISPEMVRLARERLAPFGARAEVVQSDGSPPREEPGGAYDRFVSNYVLDLLSHEDIDALLGEAWRMLVPGGRLCLVSLTPGCTRLSRLVVGVWSRVHSLSPGLVGGCRPLELREHLPGDRWRILQHAKVAPMGVSSEVLVAERLAGPAAERDR